MHVKSILSLSAVGPASAATGELSITHVTEDRNRSEFRRHVWLTVTHLIDFYLVFTPWQQIARDLNSLASALIDCAQEMEASHAR